MNLIELTNTITRTPATPALIAAAEKAEAAYAAAIDPAIQSDYATRAKLITAACKQATNAWGALEAHGVKRGGITAIRSRVNEFLNLNRELLVDRQTGSAADKAVWTALTDSSPMQTVHVGVDAAGNAQSFLNAALNGMTAEAGAALVEKHGGHEAVTASLTRTFTLASAALNSFAAKLAARS